MFKKNSGIFFSSKGRPQPSFLLTAGHEWVHVYYYCIRIEESADYNVLITIFDLLLTYSIIYDAFIIIAAILQNYEINLGVKYGTFSPFIYVK